MARVIGKTNIKILIMTYDKIIELIGKEEEYLLSHKCETILKENLHLPGADFIDRIFIDSNRNIQTLCSLNTIFKSGRLAGTGYLSILPVDLGVEHSAGASFSPNPIITQCTAAFPFASLLQLKVR